MRIIVVSAHPDDETLGAGGTIKKMKKTGHAVFWLNVTDISENMGWREEYIVRRRQQIKEINNFFLFDGFFNLALPAAKLSTIDEGELINSMKRVFDDIKPEWIIIPGAYDAHSDHRVVYNCAMSAAKTFRSPYIKRVSTMEILSETDYGFQGNMFSPNLFVDISDEIEDKLTAVRIYDTEIQNVPFPRSVENIKALAMVRGSAAYVKYAEAFNVIKQLE